MINQWMHRLCSSLKATVRGAKVLCWVFPPIRQLKESTLHGELTFHIERSRELHTSQILLPNFWHPSWWLYHVASLSISSFISSDHHVHFCSLFPVAAKSPWPCRCPLAAQHLQCLHFCANMLPIFILWIRALWTSLSLIQQSQEIRQVSLAAAGTKQG